MKILKTGFVIILWLVMAQSPLFSTIYGRVEGVVRDKDTGKGIAKVKVFLYWTIMDSLEVKTDKTGHFVFNKAAPGNDYYIICREDNYFSNIPEYMRRNVADLKHIPAYRQSLGVFNLKEGEIRQVEISLEKGGRIKGKIMQKDADGIKPFPGVFIDLYKKYEDEDIFKNTFYFGGVAIGSTHTVENGEFSYPGLRPADNYTIFIIPFNNFARQIIKDIEVRKNETFFIDFTFDFLSRTGIKGFVTKNGVPLKSVYIGFFKIPGSETFASMETDKNGQYSILMVQPGSYKADFTYYDPNEVKHKKEVRIEIEADELKTINIEF